MEHHPPTSGAGPAHKALDPEVQIRAAFTELRKRYPGWAFWITRGGRMVAATRIDPSAGPSPTVLVDTVEELEEALAWETEMAERLGL